MERPKYKVILSKEVVKFLISKKQKAEKKKSRNAAKRARKAEEKLKSGA